MCCPFFFPFIKIKITLFFVFIMKLHNIPPFCCYSFGWLCQRSKLIHPSTFWDSSFFRYQAKTPLIHLLCHFILFLGNLTFQYWCPFIAHSHTKSRLTHVISIGLWNVSKHEEQRGLISVGMVRPDLWECSFMEPIYHAVEKFKLMK